MPSTKLPDKWSTNPVRVLLVGAGGNGSQMLAGLARLHRALRGVGHPYGLHVTVLDPDVVTAANVGRQLFSAADIGHPKATVLVHRTNLFHGLNWQAHQEALSKFQGGGAWEVDLLIGCVDTAAARRIIEVRCMSHYWLDLGNTDTAGQVILGNLAVQTYPKDLRDEDKLQLTHPHAGRRGSKSEFHPGSLPHVLDLFPHLRDEKFKESNTPSCSLADALGKQDLFINQAVATAALHLLWSWFRKGHLTHHGAFINLETGTQRPLPIDPQTWARFLPPAEVGTPRRRRPKSKSPNKRTAHVKVRVKARQ